MNRRQFCKNMFGVAASLIIPSMAEASTQLNLSDAQLKFFSSDKIFDSETYYLGKGMVHFFNGNKLQQVQIDEFRIYKTPLTPKLREIKSTLNFSIDTFCDENIKRIMEKE